MFKVITRAIAPALLACLAAPCAAQTGPALTAPDVSLPPEAASAQQADPQILSPPEPQPPAVPPTLTIPALTPVSVEIAAVLGSKLSKTGDMFPIRLAAPILVNGDAAVPAGAPGVGEVVHAKKGGGSGAPGELVLAARYLDVDGRRLRLRSLHLAPVGKDRIEEAGVVTLAIGIVGLLVTGGESIVPEGTIAEAKTAEAFSLVPANAPPVEVGPPFHDQAEPTQSPETLPPNPEEAAQPIDHREKAQ